MDFSKSDISNASSRRSWATAVWSGPCLWSHWCEGDGRLSVGQ
ncbi:hypothetical protein PROFUN_09644 [Planoprotostelium fungivorum]|uniref:Uncharacterized protein n=1 Tax=Planoprotostelium fungivorum TaxID=1890364 RepID=A0A2P6MNW7_9EUKA|nr:hypothetical protein PROFUN_09644 [Planoprotostelium fungivorum]